MNIVTRFAPSPTGYLHIGGARTALFSWLFARHHGGKFLLRIEDTDRERSTAAATQAILDGMSWIGLEADEEPIFQSSRFARYGEVLEEMLDRGLAYRCYCTREELDEMRAAQMQAGGKPRYDGRCRERSAPRPGVEPAIRFKNPSTGKVLVDDQVYGQIAFDNSELDDLVIARPDGSPTYNFAVVVDDADMGITHVIRGDDHINNTPRQINMLVALGKPLPKYGHLPMIHGPDGAKLSKRHGAVSLLEYRDMGFLPEGMRNYLARLGWSHGDDEVFSTSELVRLFTLDHVSTGPARFDLNKLQWVNQQHMMRAEPTTLVAAFTEQLRRGGVDVTTGPDPVEVIVALRERASTLARMVEAARCYYQDFGAYDEKAQQKFLRSDVAEPLALIATRLAAVDEWTAAATQGAVEAVAAELALGVGAIAQPLRVALVGRAASPGIGVTLRLVGRTRSLARIERALQHIRG